MNDSTRLPRATIVYESMFGSTRRIAEAIAQGMQEAATVSVLPVKHASESFDDVDLLLVGAPTHVHSLSRPSTRAQAGQWGDDPGRALTLEPDAEGIGVREWLELCGDLPVPFAAFDTRADMPEIFSGSAAAAIEKRLTRLGGRRLMHHESFLVDKTSALEPGELDRARDWGRTLAAQLRQPVAH